MGDNANDPQWWRVFSAVLFFYLSIYLFVVNLFDGWSRLVPAKCSNFQQSTNNVEFFEQKWCCVRFQNIKFILFFFFFCAGINDDLCRYDWTVDIHKTKILLSFGKKNLLIYIRDILGENVIKMTFWILFNYATNILSSLVVIVLFALLLQLQSNS